MTITAPRPVQVARPSSYAVSNEPAPARRTGRSAAVWIDAVFYTAVTVFVASLVAYFLLD